MSASGEGVLGFLYPGYAAEDDYPYLSAAVEPPVRAEVVHTLFDEDAHTVAALSEMGSLPRILEGAGRLAASEPVAAVWSSTSASFVLGWEGAQEQSAELGRALGIPASTTALAFARAAGTLGVRRVAVAATYPAEIAARFVEFLAGVEVEALRVESRGIVTAAEVGTLGREEVRRFVSGNDHPEAEAILVPDTALHTARWLEELEEAVGKPVLTANQVTFWEGLRISGSLRPQRGLGALFRLP
jgi:maleate cis-trans isomerase